MLFEKYFTPIEANKTLPLVKQIVRDIINSANKLRILKINRNEDISDDPIVVEHLDKINNFLDELKEIGCFYKDWNFDIGLVDFPAIIENEEVMLCWKSDEEEICFFHNHTNGFAGRRQIPKKYFIEETSVY